MSSRLPIVMGRAVAFATRHAWSLSLSALSAVAFLQLASEVREGELGAFDQAAADWLASSRGRWDSEMMAFTDFGKLGSLTLVCGATIAGLAVLQRRREASYLLTSSLGCLVLCTGLKLAFHRSRPEATTQYLLSVPHSFSFPSGHAMGSTGVLLSLLIVARAMKLQKPWLVLASAGALVLAVGVAASRVYFGVHYASDVVGGELAAGGWVAAVTGWFYPRLLPAEAAVSAPE